MKLMLLELYFYLLHAEGQGWDIMKDLPCVCMHVCICHIFSKTYFSLIINISSPYLQRMFMAVKTCL